MRYPVMEIDLNKIYENARRTLNSCRAHGVEPVGVTKVCCAEPAVAQTMVDAGFTMLADSRVENLQRIAHIEVPKMLLRLPMPSDAERTVELADCSLLSENRTAVALSEAAVKQHKKHGVVLMLELGDLREGCPDERALLDLARTCADLPGLEIRGVGANLICYGGAMPSVENQTRLVAAKNQIERELSITIPWVSGGNSAVENMMSRGDLPKGVNQIRAGAMIHVGIGLMDWPIEGYHTDAYVLKAEVIERNRKPTMPYGEIGTDAFGKEHAWIDRGEIDRALIALGRADCEIDALTPIDPGIGILGGSSDHLILDLSKSDKEYRVGDEIAFAAGYVCVLRASLSSYVQKICLPRK